MRWVLTLMGALVAAVAVGVVVLVATSSSDDVLVLDLEAGDCFDLGPDVDEVIRTVEVIECDDAHEAEVVATGRLDDSGDVERPADPELFALVDARCATALAGRSALLERFGILPIAADEASWASYDGAFVCVAIPYGGGTTTGSALAATG